MLILVVNSGSSSLKYQLFDIKRAKEVYEPIAKGLIERVGSTGPKNHKEAARQMLEKLTDPDKGVISSLDKIAAIGHRVVHGGERFKESVVINRAVMRYIRKFFRLAPLHNPPAYMSIKACMEILPRVMQVAVFDTAFYQTIPADAYIYAIPYEFYKKYGIRRYGFHGTSHRFVAQKAADILKKPLGELKLITCHLGNGCSITAIKNGKSVETSMGLTPLEGLVMGTRCGDIDPAILMFLMERRHLGIRDLDDILNKKSGLLGISGISNDMRDITKAAKKGSSRARLAIDVFIHRIKKYIGAYIAVMDGADAVILTAGIGENHPWIARRIKNELKSLLSGFKTKVLVIPTNEELMIAVDTYRMAARRK